MWPSCSRALRFLLPFFLLCRLAYSAELVSPRSSISLDGNDWDFQRDPVQESAWKKVTVPSSFQSYEGTNFHGVGWYRRQVTPFKLPAGMRVLLHFQAAATEAEVWWDGQKLGTHLGGWTPFRFDITELLRQFPAGKSHELLVRLDEKVGHNTQGFLPIIAPHFGGIWQDVSLLFVPDTYVDDLSVLVRGEPKTGELVLDLPLLGITAKPGNDVTLRCRLNAHDSWTNLKAQVAFSNAVLHISAQVPHPQLWSPESPNLYEVEVGLPGKHGDKLRLRAAFRSFETYGQEFRLNGRPVNLRGVLNWGYSAPLLQPNPGEAVWRSELAFARSAGFNLMKFCLWVPPPRYLELADEAGMLVWMEYPTWHPELTGRFREPLRREFHEFFRYDRNHPSVVLRSLTCETGPSADLSVIRQLYDDAHAFIPGAVVEDDSSWIGWNRVSDFYDDHPYGNNHTWVKTLDGFKEYITGHGLKPLILGETTSADTWMDRESILAQLGDRRPWWASQVLDDTGSWLEKMRKLAGPGGLSELRPDSLRYGMLMRKYQIEAFRRELPYGGYVISVLRDVPTCSMGLLDYLGRPKWTEADWSWQRDTQLLLATEQDRRCFASGEPLNSKLLLSHFGTDPIDGATLQVSLTSFDNPGSHQEFLELTNVEQNPGTLASLADLDWRAPIVTAPTHLRLNARLKTSTGEFHNEWPLWVVPEVKKPTDLMLHRSLSESLRRELFPGCPDFVAGGPVDDTIVVASRFDDDLVHWLEGGGRVLFLPDGQSFSLPLSAHWFLRGGPYIPETALSAHVPRDFFVELQHFALAADVVPNVPQLGSIDPLLLLWDTHDQKSVKTHGVLFETRAGHGRLLVSAARLAGPGNPAGRWLLDTLLDHLRRDPAPRHELSPDVWGYLKARLHAQQTNLVARTWMFKPDPQAVGLKENWHSPKLKSEVDWKEIHIGNWWEPQGYPELDGWAWYRLWVDIPPDWKSQHVYLSFEGVDDCYELYINGQFAGKGGDLATRKDSLNEKKSYDITGLVQPASKTLLAVRVYDWYGYGGIFRPVTLGTQPFNPELDFLK